MLALLKVRVIFEELKTVVVIGGTGHFGARICRRLLREPCRLIVSSRSIDSAQQFVDSLVRKTPRAYVQAAELDIDHPQFKSALLALQPDLVIHTAGPFQGQDYRVAQACIEVRSHYVDLADGREFVLGFNCLDPEARNRGLFLVTGVSTLPGVSSAVLAEVRGQFSEISDIEISIAPAQQTPRGLSTIQAVTSYCGQPFKVLEQGRWITRHGWQDLRIQKYPVLGTRLSAACDVPDLELLANLTNGQGSVTFHAALEGWWEHLGLWLMAWCVRARLVRDWQVHAERFSRLSRWSMKLGSDRGGMHVRVRGLNSQGCEHSKTWNLTANGNHGPEIPCSPALVLARRLIHGESSIFGASPCIGLISLAELQDELKEFDIQWSFGEEG